MSKRDTQNSKILRYIEEHGSITPMEAMHFGCMRLAARIKELKAAGIGIEKQMIRKVDVDGSMVRYAQYRKAV
jgi:hypothetical protein